MKTLKLLILLVFSSATTVFAQSEDCDCKSDLNFLNSKIRKIPAFKVNKTAYEKAYSDALKQVDTVSSTFDCYVLLNTLMISLNDNHSKIYGSNTGASEAIQTDTLLLDKFKYSDIFKTYPRPNIDLDSLQTQLKNRPKESVEGIYSHENKMSIGVYHAENDLTYKAIILESQTEIWEKGEIIYNLIPLSNAYFLCAGGSLYSKRLIAFTEKIENGYFHFTDFQKDAAQIEYSAIMPTDSTYFRKELSNNITYLKIGSFDSWNPTLSEAENFYERTKGKLDKENLIIDLRNNGGGGDRNSDILFKIIKDYAKTNQVYVLINFRTISNAEQFAYKLSKLDNCLLLGSRTNGTLAYEIKDGTHDLPCGNFIAVLASKKLSKYLKLESVGIEPNTALDPNSDWIDQVQSIIENKN